MADPKGRKRRAYEKKFLDWYFTGNQSKVWRAILSISHKSGIFRLDERKFGWHMKLDRKTIHNIVEFLTESGWLICTQPSRYVDGSQTSREYKALTFEEWTGAYAQEFDRQATAFADRENEGAKRAELEREARKLRKLSAAERKAQKQSTSLSMLARSEAAQRLGIDPQTLENTTQKKVATNPGGRTKIPDRADIIPKPIGNCSPAGQEKDPGGSEKMGPYNLLSSSISFETSASKVLGSQVSGSQNSNSEPETGNLKPEELTLIQQQVKSIDIEIKPSKESAGKEREKAFQSDVEIDNLVNEVFYCDKGESIGSDPVETQDKRWVIPDRQSKSLNKPPDSASPPFEDLTPAETHAASSTEATESESCTWNEPQGGFKYPPAPEGWLEEGHIWPFRKRDPVQRTCQLCRERAKGQTDLCDKHLKWKNSVFKEQPKPIVEASDDEYYENRAKAFDQEVMSLTTVEASVILARLFHKLRTEQGDTSIPPDWETQWAQEFETLCKSENLSCCVALNIVEATQVRYSHIVTTPAMFNDRQVLEGCWEWAIDEKPAFTYQAHRIALVQELADYSAPDSEDEYREMVPDEGMSGFS
jgi:hypothetical protein